MASRASAKRSLSPRNRRADLTFLTPEHNPALLKHAVDTLGQAPRIAFRKIILVLIATSIVGHQPEVQAPDAQVQPSQLPVIQELALQVHPKAYDVL